MRRPALLFLPGASAALLAAGGAALAAGLPARSDTVRPVGAPVDCLPTSRIDQTRVQDGQTVDFRLRNGRIYRNILTNACPALRTEQRFSYRPTGGRLCRIDVIRVLERGAGGGPREGMSCGLGRFQQIEVVPARRR